MSFDARGWEREVRLLLKLERRLVRESSLRTPFGRCALGDFCAAEAGLVGVRKLSAWSLVTLDVGFCCSNGGVVGCEESGPPPGVGGSASEGERRGESAGGGMLVPSVRLMLMGVTERK